MTDLSVLMNSYHSGANAWFALAEQRGHFAAEGLTVALTAGSGAYRAPTRMADEGYDLTFGDTSALIGALGQATSPGSAAIYMIHHRSPSAIAVVADGRSTGRATCRDGI